MIGVDLFSGAGGMSLGAQLSGVKIAMAIESDPYACATYAANHKNVSLLNKDIRTVCAIKLPSRRKPVVLFGGPPCQGFSTSN
jgi:DNA (cytosine-5)-methyltransferase 1